MSTKMSPKRTKVEEISSDTKIKISRLEAFAVKEADEIISK